jgi:hypothetical protein
VRSASRNSSQRDERTWLANVVKPLPVAKKPVPCEPETAHTRTKRDCEAEDTAFSPQADYKPVCTERYHEIDCVTARATAHLVDSAHARNAHSDELMQGREQAEKTRVSKNAQPANKKVKKCG